MASVDIGVKFKESKSAWVDDDGRKEDMGFSELWKDFSQNTGFHAFNKLNPGARRNFRFFWWSFAVIGMAAYLMYNVVAELNNYYSYPKMTGFSVEMKDEMEFPAVTICSQCPLKRSAIVRDQDMDNYFLRRSYSRFMTGQINWSDTTRYGDIYTTKHSVDWWRERYDTVDALTKLCRFEGEDRLCSEIFQPVFTEVGLCYTFNGNVSNKRNVSLSGADNNLVVIFVAKQEEYVYNEQMSAGYKHSVFIIF
ncbi:acid-sensing ion channel 4-A-like [Gigantopelta aegis]|uniref:acid-sensing ion channel 4-A-like n=1 Tax=Gigantopelta aegis TaxID=1735272 RepID=UPI001B88B7E3|nr:acid-sensing ion channel 4-A-like [Gigantopelta aegis]